jgi:hypothetical protein
MAVSAIENCRPPNAVDAVTAEDEEEEEEDEDEDEDNVEGRATAEAPV